MAIGRPLRSVTEIDRATLSFGPDGATPTHRKLGHLEDVNGDAFVDLVSHYSTTETGLESGDITAEVSGSLLDGTPFEGSDAIRIVPPHTAIPEPSTAVLAMFGLACVTCLRRRTLRT